MNYCLRNQICSVCLQLKQTDFFFRNTPPTPVSTFGYGWVPHGLYC